jgi:hypothetical protein
MRTVAIAGACWVMSLTGCGLESGRIGDGAGGDEGTGEAQEASSTFTAPWKTSHFMRTRPIQAPRGGTITVVSKADFDDRIGCPAAYSAELIHFVGGREEVASIARAYPLNMSRSEVWTALAGGTYRVQFSTKMPPGKCTLRGVVTVTVTP